MSETKEKSNNNSEHRLPSLAIYCSPLRERQRERRDWGGGGGVSKDKKHGKQ